MGWGGGLLSPVRIWAARQASLLRPCHTSWYPTPCPPPLPPPPCCMQGTPTLEQLKLQYYAAMARYHLHESDYLEVLGCG